MRTGDLGEPTPLAYARFRIGTPTAREGSRRTSQRRMSALLNRRLNRSVRSRLGVGRFFWAMPRSTIRSTVKPWQLCRGQPLIIQNRARQQAEPWPQQYRRDSLLVDRPGHLFSHCGAGWKNLRADWQSALLISKGTGRISNPPQVSNLPHRAVEITGTVH